MKRKIAIITCMALLISCLPIQGFAADADRDLIVFPWYYVDSVADDGVTLNIRKDYNWDVSKLNSVEITHRMVVAERIIEGGKTIYNAVSGAESGSDKLQIKEAVRKENLSAGQYALTDYVLVPEECGVYPILYDGMTAEVNVTLPVLGFYSKPEPSLDTQLKRFFFDEKKENVFYIIVAEEDAKKTRKVVPGDEYTENACTMERIDGFTHGYKVTIHESGGYLYFMSYAEGISGKGDSVQVLEEPGRATLKSPSTSSKHTVTVKWNKQECDGYQVQIARDSKFTKGVKTYRVKDSDVLKKTIKKLSKGKKYYMRVRAYYYETDYVYGRWSKYKAITCK